MCLELKRKNNGITLIALVITIIVLLILAGVSIAILTGDNGILTQAQNAKKLTADAAQLEDTKLVIAEIELEYNTLTEETDKKAYFENKLKSYTTSTGAKIKYENGYITYNGADGENAVMKYNVNTGKIEKVSSDMNIQEYYSLHPEFHIPKGFRYLMGSASTGYVITDATEAETEAGIAGNEFVWIPVASEDDYVKRLGSNNWYLLEGSTDSNQTPSIIGDISNAVQGDALGTNKILGTSVTSGLSSEATEAKIVNAAGGFWVGRYEAGVETTSEITVNSIGTSGVFVKPGLQPYRNVSQTTALAIANQWRGSNNNTSANQVDYQAGLITGTQWDVMCNFIDWEVADFDCTLWGNYNNAISLPYTGYRSDGGNSTWISSTAYTKPSGTISVFETGKFLNSISGAQTVQKNIFDVAGNVWEWTTEVPKYNSGCRVLRGGSARNNGTNSLASYRDGTGGAGDTVWNVGFRFVLYVK